MINTSTRNYSIDKRNLVERVERLNRVSETMNEQSVKLRF